MKTICSKLSGYIAPFVVIAFILIAMNCAGKAPAAKRICLIDSVRNSQTERQVLLSQQLFMVKISPVKGNKAKKGLVNFKAELRDAFQVILYDKGKSRTELDWAMCPDGKCPIGGSYKIGTSYYKELNQWIDNAKRRNAELAEELKKLKTGTTQSTTK